MISDIVFQKSCTEKLRKLFPSGIEKGIYDDPG